MTKRQKYYLLFGILAFIALINIFLYVISPTEIVDTIGVENVYAVIFIIAVVGGLSTLTGAAFFTTLATFGAGGADPWLLGFAGGAGIFLSDSIFFLLALYGRKAIPQKWQSRLERIEKWIRQHPDWAVLSGTYVWLGFTPLPNDLLMAGLVVGGYPYKKIAFPLLAGSFTITTLTAHLGVFWSGIF